MSDDQVPIVVLTLLCSFALGFFIGWLFEYLNKN